MNSPAHCPICQKPLDGDGPRGLCPECLMRAGFPTGPEEATAGRPARKPFTPPTPEALAPSFPQLEILGLIGQGGMGAVYRARQTGLNRVVALKILPPQADADPGFAERFTREARALAQLSHPHIVGVHEFGQSGGFHFLIMEFVDGVNLRRLLESGRIDPRAALAIVPQVCDALQFAHDRGIVHRDIKPENILLDKTGTVKIADFGLAKMIGHDVPAAALTGARDVMGTPHYMAPEQVEHPLSVDHRADIYSVGVVFYQMLTGELPLGRFAVPSKKVRIDVRLDEIVLRALEKEPELRFQQASALRTEVEKVATAPSGKTSKDSAPVVSSGSASTPQSFYERWTTYWENRVHFYGWLIVGGATAIFALLLWRTPDRAQVARQVAAAADQYFIENTPGTAPPPISPKPSVNVAPANQGNAGPAPARLPSTITPELIPPSPAPSPATSAPVSGTGSLAAAEIANASFDLVEGNPEILRLQIRTATAALNADRQRYNVGATSSQNLEFSKLKLALLEARLAGDRVGFAKTALESADRRLTEAKARAAAGLVTPLNLAEVQTDRDIAAIRLREAEDRTAKERAAGAASPPGVARFDAIAEVTLGDIATHQIPELLDLATGRASFQSDVLAGVTRLTATAAADKYRERSIDVSGTLDPNTKGLAVWECIALPVGADAWDNLPPAQLAQVFTGQRAGSLAVMPGTGPLPATYAVMTRSGRMGLVQILGFSDQPRGVKIRYKLIAAATVTR